MVNSLGQEPGTVASAKVAGKAPQLSAVTGKPTAPGSDEASQLIVSVPGQVMLGFSLSLTVTLKLQVPTLPN